MPFETKMTSEQAIEKLRNLYGSEITTADIKAFCAMNDITYQTVTKKLSNFKVAKGKWNLEVTSAAVENIEKSYNSPAVLPASEKNLVPDIVKNAPHTESEICGQWTHGYTREEACFPNRPKRKFWPAVSRINNAYGDRNLVCACS